MHPNLPIAVWLVVRFPTPEQVLSLWEYDLRVSDRAWFDLRHPFNGACDAWTQALIVAEGRPALIVTEFPAKAFDLLAWLARPDTAVIRPISNPPWVWTGHWQIAYPVFPWYANWIDWTPNAEGEQIERRAKLPDQE